MLPEDVPNDHEMGDGEVPTESGGKSTDVAEEPSMASPRLIPVPDSPTNSGGPALPPIIGESGNTSVSFDQQCSPSQAPECASGNYAHLSYDQIRNLQQEGCQGGAQDSLGSYGRSEPSIVETE